MSELMINNIPMELLDSDPYKFWERLYLDNLRPVPLCDVCQQTIDDPSQWISFVCDCKTYYHKRCAITTFETFQCPSCNDCKQVYPFPKFLCKFMDHEQYCNMYHKSVEGLDSKTKLKVYKLWFHTYSIYTPPLLKLYDYLEIHNPYRTIEFLKGKQNNHQIECFDPAFIIDEDGEGMIYDTNRINYYGEKAFVNLDKFCKRLIEFSYDLIGNDFPYIPGQITLVGGAVHKCLETRINLEQIPKYSTLDILICDPDVKILTKNTKKVIKYFQDRHGKDIYWVRKTGNVLKLYVPGINRVVQIFLIRNKLEEIVNRFDFSHIQYVYDGKDIWSTFAGIEYANFLVTVHSGHYDSRFPKRFYKTKQLKLCMALPMGETLSLNLPKEVKINYWYPTYTDDLSIMQQQMKNLYGIKNQYVTHEKPCRILYSKIPENFQNYRSLDNGLVSEDDIINYIQREIVFATY